MKTEQIIELANKAEAVSYSPPPFRAVRGLSFEFEQLIRFAALHREALIESGELVPRESVEADTLRLDFLEKNFHIDATGNEPVYSTFVPVLDDMDSDSLREAIDRARSQP